MSAPKSPECVLPVGAELGEGPVWIEAEQALWFVDIKAPAVHRFDPESGKLHSWSAPEPVGWILPAASGGFAAGLKSGVHHFDPASGRFECLTRVEPDLPSNRLNDAVTDQMGRIWFGTMDDRERQATGRFYRFEQGRVAETGLPPVQVSNGPALSPDGRILYHVDSAAQTVHASEVGEDGSVSGTREFVRLKPGEGFPDGPTVDSEGCVWIALFSGWSARRYSPQGELIETIRFPVSNITKLAFGGPDLRTVYATTARLHLKPEDRERQPQAGHVFAFRSDVRGLPVVPARLC